MNDARPALRMLLPLPSGMVLSPDALARIKQFTFDAFRKAVERESFIYNGPLLADGVVLNEEGTQP